MPDCSLVLNAVEEECRPYFSNDFKTLYIPTTKRNEDLLLIKPGDTQSRYYKALSSKDYTSWTSEDYGTYHIGGKVYAEFKASDVGSGISGLYVKETVCKYSDGTNGNESVTDEARATWDETKELWCVEYNMRTAFDGIIKLELFAEDFAGNSSDGKFTFYVLKDTTVETSNIYFDTENQTMMPQGLLPGIPLTEEQRNAEENLIEYIKTMSVDQSGNQSVNLKLSENSKDVYYDSLSTDYEGEVYWGYSEDSIDTKAEKGVDGTFTFKRNVDKLVFINVVCTDQVGNTRTVLKLMIPRLELETGVSERDSGTTLLQVKGIDSIAALSDIQNPNIEFLIQYSAKYTVNGNEKTFSKAGISIQMDGEAAIRTEGSPNPPSFLGTCMESISLPEDMMGVAQTGTIKIYAMPGFGDFPVPCSTSSVDYTVTKIVKNEDSAGTGCIGQFNVMDASTGTMNTFNIYGEGPTLTNVDTSGGNSTAPQVMGTGVFGPIKTNPKISLIPVQNKGLCKIIVEDYAAEGYEGHNIAYTFSPVIFNESEEDSYVFKGNITYKSPEMYVEAGPGSLCGIHIEAHDKTDNKKYVPIPLPESEGFIDSTDDVRNFCISRIILDLNVDVEAPNINAAQYSLEDLFDSSGSYRIGGIYDENFSLENGRTKIDYYLIPNPNKTSPTAINYTLNELKNYSAFKKSLYYKPSVDGVGGEPHIDFPYGNTKEGFYTLVITAEDKFGNKAISSLPVLNTIKGELIENIKYHWMRTTNTDEGHTFKSYGWNLIFNTQGHDEIYRLEQSTGMGNFSINAYIQRISYNEWEKTYSWDQKDEILMDYYVNEETDESGKKYYSVEWEGTSTGLPWVRLKSHYGFNDGENQSPVGKGFYYTEYLYIGANDTTCFSKNCIEGLNGLQVMSDRPVFAHTMYCPEKLTETTKVSDAARIWETKGVETGIAVMNRSINEPATNYFSWEAPDPSDNHAVGSETYGEDYLKMIPSGSWYTTIFHFADGTVVMTDIKQR